MGVHVIEIVCDGIVADSQTLQILLEFRDFAYCVRLVIKGMSSILAFECLALQGFRDRYNGLCGDHAAAVFQ